MKKISVIISLLVLSLLLLSAPHEAAATEGYIDAQCAGAADQSVPIGGSIAYETFTPTYDRITKISVYLFGSDSFQLHLRDAGGTSLASRNFTGAGAAQWYDLSLSDLQVTPGGTYQVAVLGGGPVSGWGANNSLNCYSGGVPYLNGGQFGMIGDWLFKTYGFNYSAPG